MAVSATAVWLTRPRGIQWRPVLDTVRQQFPQTTLWRRQMVLGSGKEFALIAPLGVDVAAPSGWSALAIERVRVDAPLSCRYKPKTESIGAERRRGFFGVLSNGKKRRLAEQTVASLSAERKQ